MYYSPSFNPVPLNTQPGKANVIRLRRGSSIPAGLQSYECHFNWAKIYPLTLNEVGHGLLLLEEIFRDEAGEIDSLLKRGAAGVSLIGKKLIQVYFTIELGSFSQARDLLEEAQKFANDFCPVSEEYCQGFNYVLEGLRIFLKIQMSAGEEDRGVISRRRNISVRTKVSLDGLKRFKKLSAKAKYIVWTLKDIFLIYSVRSNVERNDWMEAIVEMNPYIPKWHFYLYKALHGSRKLKPRPLPLGFLEERDASHDPLSISYLAMVFAQIFVERKGKQERDRLSSTSLFPCRWGTYRFESGEEVLSAILGKTNLVLELDCHLDGVYLNFAEIHMFLLPPEDRSMELALKCLKKALRLNNTNTKTHYRMGLAQFKMKNHKQATFHFREAIKDPNNIGAIFGLLQILMASPVKNATEIQSIFKLTMRNRELTQVWDKRCLRTLHYLKGCVHFMQEKDLEESMNEAITSWIIAHDNESRKWSYYFRNLSHQCARFGWSTKRLNLTNVSNALKHVAYLEQTHFKQLLLDICDEVDDAIRRDDENRNNSG